MLEFIFLSVVFVALVAVFIYQLIETTTLKIKTKNLIKELEETKTLLVKEKQNNTTILSQKKSSEVRVGQVAEHLIPFLSKCKYDPKIMHFQGNPVDFLVYDLDQGEIIFLEVKTGNSVLSKKQKVIKNIIQAGKVYFEEIKIGTKGISTRRHKNVK